MNSELTPLLWLLSALFALWLAATVLVGTVAARQGERRAAGGGGRRDAEAGVALAASGAAVGGFLGFSGGGVAGLASLGPLPPLALLLALAGAGMLLGATLACGAAALYLSYGAG